MTDPLAYLPTATAGLRSDLALGDQKSLSTAKDFEAVFLTQFVDQMMKTSGNTAFGGEQHAKMWRSFMSEAIAKQLVEQGGLGLSGSLTQMMQAYDNQTSEQGT